METHSHSVSQRADVPQGFSGVFAAMPTPFGPDGLPDVKGLDSLVDFLLDAGLDGLCVGGATGEYAAFGPNDRIRLFRHVAERVGGRLPLIFGVGAENSGQVLRLSETAAECGGGMLLLPPAAYFRYVSGDFVEFIRQVSEMLPLPTLLYNVPQFTNPIELSELLRLVESVANVVGIKDSSGDKGNLPLIAETKARVLMLFFAGNDSLLFDSLQHGADGAVSGIASACPELLLALYNAHRDGQVEWAMTLQAVLDEFIAQLEMLPVPWGIKLALEARGFPLGSLGWPLGPRLQTQIAHFRQWFPSWLGCCLRTCA